jgi:hypothetical protein
VAGIVGTACVAEMPGAIFHPASPLG